MRLFCLVLLSLACAAVFSGMARAAEEYALVLRDHRFVPDTLEIPAGQKVKLRIVNEDPSAEEFESYELNREKIIRGGGEAVVFVGPLAPGSYPFFGEFNPDTARGVLIVKE